MEKEHTSSQTLIDILTLYGASISDVEVKKNKMIYYIKLEEKSLVMPLDDTLNNIYKVLSTFTFPNENIDGKVELKYEVV